MGNWYTNVSLKGVDPSDVLAHLKELGRVALVTPSFEGWVVVFDQECDKFDIDTVESLALTLSTQLQCPAVASLNADDDILWFAIYENGRRTSRYASAPREFEDHSEFPTRQEFAETLCRIFEKPDRVRPARAVLARSHGILGLLSYLKIRIAYIFEIQRHQDLAVLLALPVASVGVGYNYASRGELPAALQPGALLRTD